ncbi:hypothetical protein [Dapis sp. BLCC M126]
MSIIEVKIQNSKVRKLSKPSARVTPVVDQHALNIALEKNG